MPLNNLQNSDEIYDLFGHRYSEEEILSLYPCDTGTFNKEVYDKPGMTITYDIHTAYDLRMNNHRAFVFCKSRPKVTLF